MSSNNPFWMDVCDEEIAFNDHKTDQLLLVQPPKKANQQRKSVMPTDDHSTNMAQTASVKPDNAGVRKSEALKKWLRFQTALKNKDMAAKTAKEPSAKTCEEPAKSADVKAEPSTQTNDHTEQEKTINKAPLVLRPIEVKLLTKKPPNRPKEARPVPIVTHVHTGPKHRHRLPYPKPVNKFPKGIPRSFLVSPTPFPVQQPNLQPQPSTSNPNITIWTPQLANAPTLEPTAPAPVYNTPPTFDANQQLCVTIDNPNVDPPQVYSPSDVYFDAGNVNEVSEPREGSESPDLRQSIEKRLSAFQRLGPLTQPKKPKLTINLTLNKEQAVREVVDETDADRNREYSVPVHMRKEILNSTDETVVKHLPKWPWKRNVLIKKYVTVRNSKSVMILEKEQMLKEIYHKDDQFIQISVKGYPPSWRKEDVLDTLLDNIKGKSFIPCFIDFTPEQCRFLVIRCMVALIAIHKLEFCIRKGDVKLIITISQPDLTTKHLDFIPRLEIRQRLDHAYDGERKLNLKEFTLKSDVSHFIYYPLNRLTYQAELIDMQSAVAWDYITDLDLSHNRITCMEGFDLSVNTPRLKRLQLSHNRLERVTDLLICRGLTLHSVALEGNPLCNHYIHPEHYVTVLRMIFPALKEIDGVPLHFKGDMPPVRKHYCPEDAKPLVNKFLEVYFPLLDSPPKDRAPIKQLYDDNAVMTITARHKLQYSPVYRYFRNLFMRCRDLSQDKPQSVNGAGNITKWLLKWPAMQHDPFALTVDVFYHTNTTTILRIGGILKLLAETLAEDEHLLAFTRTFVLTTSNGYKYQILNEMMSWDEPSEDYAHSAFRITAVMRKPLSLKLDSPPDDDLKEKLLDVFMKLTNLDRNRSEKCLETKGWNFATALEYFVKLLKLDNLNSISVT